MARLIELTPTESLELELESAWRETLERAATPPDDRPLSASRSSFSCSSCRDEKQQVELLGRFKAEGLACKALVW